MHCTCHVLSSAALPLARRLRDALAATPWRGPAGETLSECRLSAPRRFAPEDCRPFAGVMDAARQAAGFPQIFVGAAGIAVRAVAPLLGHKSTDAPVLVVSPDGHFVISLLAGHWGGGNSLCRHVAALLGAVPVITTATDCGERPALDLFLQTAGLRILDWDQLPPAQACWLEGRPLPLWDPFGAVADGEGGAFLRQEDLPEQEGPALCVHWQRLPARQGRLRVALPALVLGLGCRKGVPAPLVATAVEGLLLRYGLEPQALAALATVTEKAREPALQELARRLGLPLLTFEAAELAGVTTPHPSMAAGERFGCAPFSVCEAASLLAARQMGATGTATPDANGAWPARPDGLGNAPPAGAGNGSRTDGTDAPAARLLVEKTRVAGQLTLAVALSTKGSWRDDD